jgi:hypothetical protein
VVPATKFVPVTVSVNVVPVAADVELIELIVGATTVYVLAEEAVVLSPFRTVMGTAPGVTR